MFGNGRGMDRDDKPGFNLLYLLIILGVAGGLGSFWLINEDSESQSSKVEGMYQVAELNETELIESVELNESNANISGSGKDDEKTDERNELDLEDGVIVEEEQNEGDTTDENQDEQNKIEEKNGGDAVEKDEDGDNNIEEEQNREDITEKKEDEENKIKEEQNEEDETEENEKEIIKDETEKEDSKEEQNREEGKDDSEEQNEELETELTDNGFKTVYEKADSFYVVKNASSIYMATSSDELNDAFEEEIPGNVLVAVTAQENIDGVDWSHVNYLGMDGWMKDEDLEFVSSDNSIEADDSTVYVNIPLGETLTVRADCSDEAQPVRELGYGNEVQLIREENGWGKISVEGEEGWVDLRKLSAYVPGYFYVNVDSNEPLNARQSADVNSEVIDVINNGTKVEINEFQNGWGKYMKNGQECWLNLRFLTPCSESYTAVVQTQTTSPYNNQQNNQTQIDYYQPSESYNPDPVEPAAPAESYDDSLTWEEDDDLSWSGDDVG